MQVNGPDIRASGVEAQCENAGTTVRLGLTSVRRLGKDTAVAIVAERTRNGSYVSIADLALRVRITTEQIEALALLGALERLTESCLELTIADYTSTGISSYPTQFIRQKLPKEVLFVQLTCLSAAMHSGLRWRGW